MESKNSTTEDVWYPDQLRGVKEINLPHLEAHISELKKAFMVLTKDKESCRRINNLESA